jgi:dipeptidyl-peptidase-4
VQSRDQRTVRFLVVGPDGATTVAEEWRDQRWVQPVTGLPARTGSGALVAHQDDGETRHLTVAGAPVTPAGLQLRAVHGIDGDDVLFGASEDPTETQLWSYRPDRGLRRLTGGPAVHSGVAKDGTLIVVTRDGDRPGGRVQARRRDEPAGVDIGSRVERAVVGVRGEPLVLGPRGLRGRLFVPSWFGGGGRLPVVVDPYGGAAVQRVTAELEWRSVVSQWFAEHGFAVLVVDGRGTPGRGPGWEKAVHGDVFGPVLEDQVDALHGAARLRPELDLGRVGIRGWSFSGSLAVAAVLRRPDVFHAAVAGAMVTDQRLYNTRWRERALGHPDEAPERYEATSLLAEAHRLSRPLLLMHGLADDNVHAVNTMRLHGALLDAGREHELVLLPGIGHHAIGHPTSTTPVLRRQLQFLHRHLTAQP